MERLLQLSLFFGVFLVVVTSANECVKSVFLFGDSQFDAGNNRFIKNCTTQANFPPYGSTYFPRPTGRFTDGRTVADFIEIYADQYLGIEFQRPFQEVYKELINHSRKYVPANGINFASGGSGVLRDTNKMAAVTPIQEQLQQLQTLIDQKYLTRKQIEDSMFFFESGARDIFNYFLAPHTQNLNPEAYGYTLLKEVALFIDKISKLGARRIAIFAVGQMGCVPARVLIQGAPITRCFDKLNYMSQFYNSGLELLVNNISIRYPHSVGVYGAVYETVEKIRAYSKLHGFANVDDACCGGGMLNGKLQCGLKGYQKCQNPKWYFFWDYFNPSQHTYRILAKDLWEGNEGHVRPMNLKALACKSNL